MGRILVTGGSGLLGSRIVEALAGKCELYYSFNSNRVEIAGGLPVSLDVSSPACTKKIIGLAPDTVFHTSALTNVDYCELRQQEAFAVNAQGAKNVAIACREVGAKMIHLSTDYVFDGGKGNYAEGDAPNPINYYGTTKLESENIVSSLLDDCVIARTTVIFGWNRDWQRENFATWVINSLRAGKRILLANDQFGNPTLAENLASALIELAISNKKGIYHIAGSNCISRLDFGTKIADVFSLDKNLIKPVTSEELSQTAPRPRNNCLSNKKAAKELKTRLFGVEEALLIMEQQEKEKHEREREQKKDR